MADCIPGELDYLKDSADPLREAQEKLRQVELQKRQKALQVIAINRLVDAIEKHPQGIAAGLMATMTRDHYGTGVAVSIEARAAAINNQVAAQWWEGLQKYRSKAAGLRQDREGMRELVRVLFGKSTDDDTVSRIADQWKKVTEDLRQRFNRAGGDIRKLEGWALPQFHDMRLIVKAGPDEWKQAIQPMLDRSRMVDADGNPLTDEALDAALDKAYAQITTEGLASMKPGVQAGKKLANRHQDARFLHFKDGDAWLAYHDRFGSQDIYATMTDHLHRMATEIAVLESYGPNPNATYKYLSDMVRKQFAPGGDLDYKKRKNTQMQYMDSVWNIVSGKAHSAVNPTLADFSNSARHLLVSAKLGGAFLSAMSDTVFNAMTRKFNGLPVWQMGSGMLKQLDPTNEADRLFAVQIGLGAEAWMNTALAANRFSDVYGANKLAKFSDFTMRASGLTAWTDAGRKSFGMEFTAMLAKRSGQSFDQLGRAGKQAKAFKKAMQRYGITAEEWDTIRQVAPLEHRGVQFLRPLDIIENRAALGLSEREANDLSAKVLAMINTEADFAVPMPDARVQAITTMGGQQRGTVSGELARHLFLFKSFPITILMQQASRWNQMDSTLGKIGWLSTAFVGTTLLGAIAMQAKDISRGRDPRPADNMKFWLAAAMQGGGAGIVGDFLFSEESRFGQGPLQTLLGPTYGLANDTVSLVLDNAKAGAMGEDMNLGRDLVRYGQQYTPAASIWYTRLAIERGIFDKLNETADPGATRKAWKRMMRKRQRDYGQGYWWKPGTNAPQRAPE